MRIAVVYNRESENVINLFGTPGRERMVLKSLKSITDALKKGGHQVTTLEGDKDFIERLEEFMPRVVKGERPGMVFNVSYGIQGQARYTHVPSILEMLGIPYVASGPLAHSLALDKVVTKMILRQSGLPTPDFAVLDSPKAPTPALRFPMILKPKNEALSFGLTIVRNEAEFRKALAATCEEFQQPVLAEEYVQGREINVGLLGNNPPEALTPVELRFGRGGPPIYTHGDKTGESGRDVKMVCPARIGQPLRQEAQELAKKAFTALGCCDCARVDLRLDRAGNLFILEVNSLPGLGENSSYAMGAAHAGIDYTRLINRLLEVASARYFGTPEPPAVHAANADPSHRAFAYITQRRDRLEKRLKEWTAVSSRTADPVGLQHAVERLQRLFKDLGLKPVRELTDQSAVLTWGTDRGLDGGTLFIGNLDVPIDVQLPPQMFRSGPEWLHGEGVGCSRAPLVMLEFALRSLRSLGRLDEQPIGVLYYTDEGLDARHSGHMIRAAAGRAKRVFVLTPGHPGDFFVTQRRGQRKYGFRVEGEPLRHGRLTRRADVLRWAWGKLDQFAELTSLKDHLSVSTIDLRPEKFPMRLPHRVTATVLVTYPHAKVADATEQRMRSILGREGPEWDLELISDRPPMLERRRNLQLARALAEVAGEWEIPLKHESSSWPSVAGLVPAKTACVCGIGPVAQDLLTPNEAVQRISLVQRTLLLAQWLARNVTE